MARKTPRLIGVDLARILAAWMVMAFHLAYWSWAGAGGTIYSILQGAYAFPELRLFSSFGWVGVQVFFVISGLVIACSAERATALDFARRRFLRLFPGAVISATLTLAVALAIEWKPAWELAERYVRSILFVPFGPWMDGAYWTLGIEVSFYMLIGIFIFARRHDRIEHAALAVGVCSAAYLFATHFPDSFANRKAELLLLQHGVYFALGCTIWHGFQRGWTWPRVLSGASLGIVCFLGIVWLPPSGLLAAVVWTTVTAALVLSLHYDDSLATGLRRVVPAIKMLSLATYPLYLIHTVVGASVMLLLAKLELNRFLALFSVCALLVATSVLITLGPERLLRNILAWIPIPWTVSRAASSARIGRRAS